MIRYVEGCMRASIVRLALRMQVLPPDYWKEFVRVPYAAVTAFTLGAYLFHPIMQQAAFYLRW